MAKKPKSKRKAAKPRSKVVVAPEDRRAEAVSVAWMLTMMATLGAEVVGGLLRLVLVSVEAFPTSLHALPGLMLFTATITGGICLLITPLVYHFRRVPPPTGVTVLAVTVSIVPMLVGIMMSLR